MFTPFYRPQQQHLGLAALAEAKAAEAAAMAAEAEYLALEAARARAFEQQSAYYHRPSPSFSNYFAGSYPVPFTNIGYMAPRPYFETYSQGYPQQSLPPFAAQPSPVERELEAKLKEERAARLKAEHQLKLRELQLKQREQRTTRPIDEPFSRSAVFGYPVFSAHPKEAAVHGPSPANNSTPVPTPTKPAPATTSHPENDSIERFIIQSIFGVPVESKAVSQEPTPKKVEGLSKPKPAQTPVGSLIDQLKARGEKEGEDEVRDTIQAVINSLVGGPEESPTANKHTGAAATISSLCGNPAQDLTDSIWVTINAMSAVPSAQPASQSKQQLSTAGPSLKGKEKEASTQIISTSKDVVNALERVESIELTFKRLAAEFTFPSQLDFVSTTTLSLEGRNKAGDLPHLAFTARNHPVHYYEQNLTTLLTQLDRIESHGNEMLRHKRKDAVDLIERALEELEQEIVGRWNAKVQKESGPSTSESEQASPTGYPESFNVPIVDNETAREESTQAQGSGEFTGTPEVPRFEQNVLDGPLLDESAPVSAKLERTPAPEFDLLAVESQASTTDDNASPSLFAEEQPRNEAAALETSPEPLTASVPGEEPEVEQTPVILVPSSVDNASASESSPVRPTTLNQPTNSDDDSTDDTFLLGQPSSPAKKAENTSDRARRASVEVEDLGSDWSDLDA